MGLGPFQYLKYWIISLFPLKWGITKTGRLTRSSPWKAKQHTMMSNTKEAYCGAECEHIKGAQLHGRSLQPLTEAGSDNRHNEWVSSYACLWAHSGRGSSRRMMIASGKQSFPSQTSWDTPYLQSWYGWKNFFHALIDRSVPTSLVHSSSIHSWKVPRTCKASWDF